MNGISKIIIINDRNDPIRPDTLDQAQLLSWTGRPYNSVCCDTTASWKNLGFEAHSLLMGRPINGLTFPSRRFFLAHPIDDRSIPSPRDWDSNQLPPGRSLVELGVEHSRPCLLLHALHGPDGETRDTNQTEHAHSKQQQFCVWTSTAHQPN
jgi:hypothetical protein